MENWPELISFSYHLNASIAEKNGNLEGSKFSQIPQILLFEERLKKGHNCPNYY